MVAKRFQKSLGKGHRGLAKEYQNTIEISYCSTAYWAQQGGQVTRADLKRLTIREFLGQLAPRFNPCPPAAPNCQAPKWPPDMFAFCMSLLLKGGAYCAVLKNWPPRDRGKRVSIRAWVKRVRNVGSAWHISWVDGKVPSDVSDGWDVVLENLDRSVSSLAGNIRLSQKLLELCAMADEACSGIGLPQGGRGSGHLSKAERAEARFHAQVRRNLRLFSSACEEISSIAYVHCPKCGPLRRD